MSTTATILSNLKALAGKPNDDTYLKLAIVKALREVRHVRAPWSEGTFRFYTENGTDKYTRGTYPGLPEDLIAFDTVRSSISTVSNALIRPTSVGANSTGNFTSTITLLTEDRPHDVDPRGSSYYPTSHVSPTIYEVVFATPTAAVPSGSNRQKIRYNAKTVGTPANITVSVIDRYGTDYTVYTDSGGSITSSNSVIEIEFDARLLNENPPTELTFYMSFTHASDVTANYVELNSVEWLTDTASSDSSIPLEFVTIDQLQDESGLASSGSNGIPSIWSWHDDSIYLEPTPSGVYEIFGTYLKDSARDSSGDEITVSFAGTETNDWLQRGQAVLEAKALEVYYMTRARDPQGAEMARLQYLDALKSINREFILKKARGPVRGWL